jgi:hypothetical protein
MRKLQREGVDRNKLIAAFTEMWLDAQTKEEADKIWVVVLSLTGAAERRPVQAVEAKEPDRILGPLPDKDNELDAMLQLARGR